MMIPVHVELVGAIRRPWKETSRTVQVPEGTTLAALLSTLGFAPSEHPHIVVWVNAERKRPDYVVQQQDKVTMGLLIGGG